jgi:hypothetical protein
MMTMYGLTICLDGTILLPDDAAELCLSEGELYQLSAYLQAVADGMVAEREEKENDA